MASFILCECCGGKLPVVPADVGRAVMCPVSRRLVNVDASSIHTETTPPRHAAFRARRIGVILALLLLLGLASYLATNHILKPADRRDLTAEQLIAKGVTPLANPGIVAAATGSKTKTVSDGTDNKTPGNITATPNKSGTSGLTIGSSSPLPRPKEPPPVELPSRPTPQAVSPPAVPGIQAGERDRMGFVRFQLAKRIDPRSAEDLEKELQSVREVSLDTPTAPQTSTWLFQYGISRRAAGLIFQGPAVVARKREDLASLPFRYGTEATLSREQALALDAYSKRLRVEIQRCIPAGRTDPRPDPDKLFQALLAGDESLFRDAKWARAEAVPCIQQMLQAENREVRRVAVELLRGISDRAATEALVQWAVFDLDAGHRAAAVDCLRTRNRGEVAAKLVAQLRHPWPRAAEHAAEALVALGCIEAVPGLIARLESPDPTAILAVALPDFNERFRQEMVRVNHAKNCVMCHVPSPVETDLVRGAIPDPSRPLPGATTPSYYSSGGSFVSASTTYLKQDFSAVLKVAAPGQWSEHQRFDFLVTTRPAKSDEQDSSQMRAQYEAAILFALRELTDRDLGKTDKEWAALRGAEPGLSLNNRMEAARYLILNDNPEAYLILAFQEFGRSLLALTPQEQAVVLTRFRKAYGPGRAKLALIAYLEGVVRSGSADDRTKAEQMLAAISGTNGDSTVVDGEVAAKLLGHSNSGIRAAAATALGLSEAGGKAHIKSLIAALSDADAEVRLAAATAIGGLSTGPDEMYDALAKATADASSPVRLAAAEVLAKFKYLPRSSAKPLVDGFITRGKWATAVERVAFEKACLVCLLEMKSKAEAGYGAILSAAAGDTPTDVSPQVLANLLNTIGTPGKGNLPELVKLLTRNDYKAVATAQLGQAPDTAVPLLIRAIKDENAKVRAAAAEALGRIASLKHEPPVSRSNWRAAIDALGPLRSDSDPDVKAAAMAAFMNLNAP